LAEKPKFTFYDQEIELYRTVRVTSLEVLLDVLVNHYGYRPNSGDTLEGKIRGFMPNLHLLEHTQKSASTLRSALKGDDFLRHRRVTVRERLQDFVDGKNIRLRDDTEADNPGIYDILRSMIYEVISQNRELPDLVARRQAQKFVALVIADSKVPDPSRGALEYLNSVGAVTSTTGAGFIITAPGLHIPGSIPPNKAIGAYYSLEHLPVSNSVNGKKPVLIEGRDEAHAVLMLSKLMSDLFLGTLMRKQASGIRIITAGANDVRKAYVDNKDNNTDGCLKAKMVAEADRAFVKHNTRYPQLFDRAQGRRPLVALR
jgi:hypothetical protein